MNVRTIYWGIQRPMATQSNRKNCWWVGLKEDPDKFRWSETKAKCARRQRIKNTFAVKQWTTLTVCEITLSQNISWHKTFIYWTKVCLNRHLYVEPQNLSSSIKHRLVYCTCRFEPQRFNSPSLPLCVCYKEHNCTAKPTPKESDDESTLFPAWGRQTVEIYPLSGYNPRKPCLDVYGLFLNQAAVCHHSQHGWASTIHTELCVTFEMLIYTNHFSIANRE